MRVKTISLLLTLAVIALGATSVAAQTSRGTVTGVVTDPQDQVISGAEVELKNAATNVSRTTTTNDTGLYRFDAVDLGRYDVIIRAKGFKTSSTAGVLAQANLATNVNVKMEVGTQEETVNVNAGVGELLQTTEPVRSGNFSPVQVASLPSSGLNPYDLGRLLPGVVTASGGAQFGNASQFSINGQRPRGNNYLIDGTENNDISVTGPANQINNEDAIAEVSVQTGLFSAEFGRAGGGVFNLVTKRGENEYHGTVKWLYLSQVFNSLTSTEKAVSKITRDGVNGTPKFSVFDENIFGGSIGGPLPLPIFGEGGKSFLHGKDRNWFFFGLQFDRFHSSSLQQPRIPTEAGVQTLRALFPAGTNPRVDLYLATIGNERGVPSQSPLTVALGTGPNGAGVTVARGNLETALANVGLPSFSFDHQWVLRTDHNISDKHQLSIRYTDDKSLSNLQSFAVHPDFTADFNGISRNLLFTHTWIVTSSFTNEFRISPYGIIDFQFPYGATSSPAARTLQNISWSGTGNPSTIGLATNLPQGRRAKNFLLQDTATKVFNTHTFRFGVEFLKQTARQRPPFNERGSFGFTSSTGFSSFANFIDNFSGPGGTANINFGVPFYTPNLFRQSYFVQDTWKAKPNLTLTIGTRYEDFGQPANNAFKFPAFAGFDPAQFLVPNKVKRDRNNFGPLFGFAYSPQWESGPIAWLLPKDRSVIRGGYQVSYDTWFNNLLSNIAADSPNNTSTTTTASGSGRGNSNFFPNAIPSTPVSPNATNTQTSVFNPNIRNPYTQRWSLGLQRELPWGLVMDASYVGTAGRKLFVSEDLNPIVNPSLTTAACPNCGRLFPALGIRRWRTSGADSEYHSGQLRIDKRLSRGLQFGASYTWSKNMDSTSEVFTTGNTQSSLASVPAFLGGLKLDWAPSDYDRRHRFVFNYVWDLPIFRGNNHFVGKVLGGWQWNGIVTFQSGAPFTIANGRDRNGDGQIGPDRPDLGNPNAPHNTRAQIATSSNGPTCVATTGLVNPDTGQCVTRNDVYVVQIGTATGTSLVAPGPATLGRNTEHSNWVQNFDMSLFKTFRLNERWKIEYRVEAFNVFNHPQQTGLPGLDVTNTTAGRFLNYDFVSGGRRTARMGLKIIF